MRIFSVDPDVSLAARSKEEKKLDFIRLGVGYRALKDGYEMLENMEGFQLVDWENDQNGREEILARMDEMARPENMSEEEREVYWRLSALSGVKKETPLRRAIKNEVAQRIQSRAPLETQVNLMIAALSGRLSETEKRTLELGWTWIENTRATGRKLVEAEEEDFSVDGKWPHLEDEAARLFARF